MMQFTAYLLLVKICQACQRPRRGLHDHMMGIEAKEVPLTIGRYNDAATDDAFANPCGSVTILVDSPNKSYMLGRDHTLDVCGTVKNVRPSIKVNCPAAGMEETVDGNSEKEVQAKQEGREPKTDTESKDHPDEICSGDDDDDDTISCDDCGGDIKGRCKGELIDNFRYKDCDCFPSTLNEQSCEYIPFKNPQNPRPEIPR